MAALRPRVVIPADDPPQLQGSPHLARLEAEAEVRIYDNRPSTDEEKIRRVAGATCMINSRSACKWPGSVLRRCPDLRMITVCGIGTDAIDVAAAKELGIAVCNIPGKTAKIVAEHALALMFAVARNAWRCTEDLKRGLWKARDLVFLHGKKLGVIGAGPIGAEMMRLGQAVGMEVCAWTFHPANERSKALGVPFVPLKVLLATSDVVSIHLPLSDRSRGLLSARELSLMKRGSVLVNTGRGAIVDHLALVEMLRSEHLYGAGIDVFPTEPLPADDPILSCPNVVLTPHIADQTPEGMDLLNGGAVDNVLSFLRGTPIHSVI
ncbi:MAG: NAD(P)-dependent oxidoreductase [Gemmataceae bacterium]